jgi:hypothetical protein
MEIRRSRRLPGESTRDEFDWGPHSRTASVELN